MAMVQGNVQTRYRRRVPCRIRLGESRYSGLVLNLSRTGLFVQTSASAEPGDLVHLEISGEIALRAQVVWRRQVAARLRSIVHGGIGIRISSAAPEEYYQLLVAAAGLKSAAETASRLPQPEPRPGPVGTTFRARLKQCDGPRSRTVDLVAPSLEEAERKALAGAGYGWTLIHIERRP